MTIEMINRSRRRRELLVTAAADIEAAINILRDLRPGPERWRESAALQILELAHARIVAEEEVPTHG